ncbi:MAG TPA: hypothetical protein VEU08_15120 [Vicinamibacterales bacterium]|nr:hypothetical protein [Vicinamibacterales bacterium]
MFIVLTLAAVANAAGHDARLRPLNPIIGDAAIVGRAACRGATWLLTVEGNLIQIAPRAARTVAHAVPGLRASDRFWGLACLDDGSLWTLATAHVLARLSETGTILERRDLSLPHVELFAFRDRFVFLSLPVVNGRSVLATARRPDPEEVRPWTGLLARSASGGNPAAAINLVGCGISSVEGIPCWFSNESLLWIGDGIGSRTISVQSRVRDAALTSAGVLWVLEQSDTVLRGRRVGDRVTAFDREGTRGASIPLLEPARLIVTADAETCVLLTVNGNLMQLSMKEAGR